MSFLTILSVTMLVVCGVGALGFGVYTLANPSRTAIDRLRELQDEEEEDDSFTIEEAPDKGMEQVAEKLGRLAQPQSEEEAHQARLRLLQAGYKSRHALEIFNGVRVTLAFVCPLFTIPFVQGASTTKLLGAVLVAACVGYYAPQTFMNNFVVKRQKILLNFFPDSLDLLVSSVEAGLGLDAAFRRVATEMEGVAPDLSKEYQLVNHEINAGVSRIQALKHLEQRSGLEEIRSMVNMLAQAERFGTSIAKSLRVHANLTRQKRMSKAEEEAAKVSPKMTVVMILFLMPVLMSILLGPALIQVFNKFAG
jgi:tight adherence protein C